MKKYRLLKAGAVLAGSGGNARMPLRAYVGDDGELWEMPHAQAAPLSQEDEG
jgi:hypothetical protein